MGFEFLKVSCCSWCQGHGHWTVNLNFFEVGNFFIFNFYAIGLQLQSTFVASFPSSLLDEGKLLLLPLFIAHVIDTNDTGNIKDGNNNNSCL